MGIVLWIDRNCMGGKWPPSRRPMIMKFLNSPIRKRVSGYSNYFRLVWWKIDLTVEWER